jgi:hypothetical protein
MMGERNACAVLNRKSEKLLLSMGLERCRVNENIRSAQEDKL